MKSKVGYLTIFFICMTTILEVFAGSASAADSKGRKEISSGERALTMLEGQNTFSYADE